MITGKDRSCVNLNECQDVAEKIIAYLDVFTQDYMDYSLYILHFVAFCQGHILTLWAR